MSLFRMTQFYFPKALILSFLFAFAFSEALAQSENDLYTDVQQLILNSAAHSSTSHNTVQKSCVDEKLTGRCIQYHNDQWFAFTPDSTTPFFINVHGQSCQNSKGVQLVVFTGELCETSSYEVISCISKATAEDFYFKVEHPNPRLTYYFIVDGYLGDFCDFRIEVSGSAKGMPAVPGEEDGEGTVRLDQHVVTLSWFLGQSTHDDFDRFFVRRTGGGNIKTWNMPVEFNTMGKTLADYKLPDTLIREGHYEYKVYLVNDLQERHLFLTKEVSWKRAEDGLKSLVYFPFQVPRKTNLQVTVRDPFTGRVLASRFVENYRLSGFEYDFSELINKGQYFFEVHVQDLTTKRKEVFTKSFTFE